VAQQADQIAGSTAASDAARDWEAIRAATDIQYAPLSPSPPKPPPQKFEPPGWLESFGQWLQNLFSPLGLPWQTIQWILIGLGVLLAALLIWKLVVEPMRDYRRRPKLEAEEEWVPTRAKAVALLDDADRLASEGKYGEAAHLLLQRSVSHIAEARPDWLHPASTAREIASLGALPEQARSAFSVIAGRVERSLFALRDLDLSDWQAARSAYANFALQELRPGNAAT
jgi:hypothetical protein